MNFEERKERKNKNSEGTQLSWLVIGDGNSTSVYNSSDTYLVPWTEIEPHSAITTQPEESKRNRWW